MDCCMGGCCNGCCCGGDCPTCCLAFGQFNSCRASNTISCFPDYRQQTSTAAPSQAQQQETMSLYSTQTAMSKTARNFQKKYHAYRKIWNCNKFPKGPCQERRSPSSEALPGQLLTTISWRNWPPPIVPVPAGLKLPVVEECEELPGAGAYSSDRDSIAGEDDGAGRGRYTSGFPEFQLQEELTRDSCLKGVLNTYESETFSVQPSSVVIDSPEKGQTYKTVVKVRNKGLFPRRMSVVVPHNPCIDVAWGAGIGETTLLPPGLTRNIVIQLSSPCAQDLNEAMTIIIDEDGAIVVPIIAKSSPVPVLQLEEWDLGCSILGTASMKTFNVSNKGQAGRFWILTEEEFTNEYIEIRGLKPPAETKQGGKSSSTNKTASGVIPVESKKSQLENPPSPLTDNDDDDGACERREKMLKKANNLKVPPFRIFPSCFKLLENQYMPIQIRYRPKTPEFHARKLVILCDNGEVRWIAVKGIGIDNKRNPVVEIQGTWTAPPIDLPSDLSTRITVDCGDLIAGENKSECFAVKNNSCMTLYYFLATRPTRLFNGPVPATVRAQNNNNVHYQSEGFLQAEWRDYGSHVRSDDGPSCEAPIKVYPSHGILRAYETIDLRVTVQAPVKQGFHSKMLSIFVQQLGEQQEKMLLPLLSDYRLGRTDPVPFETLLASLSKHFRVGCDNQKLKATKSARNNGKYEDSRRPQEVNQAPTQTKDLLDSSNLDNNGVVQTLDTSIKPKNPKLEEGLNSGRRGARKKSRADKLAFPPFPFLYVKEGVGGGGGDEGDQEIESVELARLEYPLTALSKNILKFDKWSDGDSLDGDNQDEEFVYEEYFEKICTLSNEINGEDEQPGEDGDLNVIGNNSELKTVFETWMGRNSNEIEGELEDMGNKEEAKLGKLDYENCVLAGRAEEAKPWLSTKSPLQPFEEIEIWLKTIALNCYFNPPVIVACGTFNTKIHRTLEFFNHSPHPVQLTLDSFVNEIGSIICSPFEVQLESMQTTSIRLSLDFRQNGDWDGRLKGRLTLPFTSVPLWIPFRLRGEGPQIEILTPLVNFNIVLEGTEHRKTVAIKNNGTLRTKWSARILTFSSVESGDPLGVVGKPGELAAAAAPSWIHAWPEWGTVEPNETVGIQIYLSAPPSAQNIAATCRIDIAENPEYTQCVTILAKVQSPKVILKECRLTLEDAYRGLKNYSVRAELKNLTSLPTPFKWLQPFGTQSEFCSVQVFPESGELAPKASALCQLEFYSDVSLSLTNIFIPCCIGGVKEPLLVKVEGTVFSLCLKIIIPKTRLHRVTEEEIPRECRSRLWPGICGRLPKEEIPGEEGHFIQSVRIYGKYCLINTLDAPPPSTTDLVKEAGSNSMIRDVMEGEHNNSRDDSDSKLGEKGLNKNSEVKPAVGGDQAQRFSKKSDGRPGISLDNKKQVPKLEEIRGEDPFEILGEDDIHSEEIMESEGRLIYFQIRSPQDVDLVTFKIVNESPLSAVYTFRVVNHPVTVPVEEAGRFVKLDDAFWKKLTDQYIRPENFLEGRAGAVFNVYPSEGIVDAYASLEVMVEFHANTDGIFLDYLECYFEGLEQPYVIKLEALAVMCSGCSNPDATMYPENVQPESPPSSPKQLCVRRKNPLLYY